ncbi:hypothetical protein G6F66_015670 [Rhizopus arrhizus]|nr:hypothetical protein G6F66_015670 [Rhizopus arrhizus]
MNLLQNLARYVFGSGNVFEDGHHLNANGPIALETGTRLCHLAFIADPQLPAHGGGQALVHARGAAGAAAGDAAVDQ